MYWAAPPDVGWVVGHSYIVYGPLMLGATTVLYEGKPVGTPDAGAFWRVAAEHGVKALFTAPTAIRAIKKEDPDGLHMSRARPGPRCRVTCSRQANGSTPAPTTGRRSGWRSPVVDHWWQTGDRLGDRSQPDGCGGRCPSSPGRRPVPMPGYDVAVLRPDGVAGRAE